MKQLLALALLLLFGCSEVNTKNQKPKILVTIAPYHFLVQAIVKDKADIEILIPPGANPHGEINSSKIKNLANVSLWLQTGDFSEKRMKNVLSEQYSAITMVDINGNLPLICGEKSCCSHHHEHKHKTETVSSCDLHTWLAPDMLILQIETIEKAVTAKFPEHADFFHENTTILKEKITAAKRKIHSYTYPKAILIVHPSLSYLCKELAIEQISIEQEGKESTLDSPGKIVARAKELGINKIYTLPTFQKGANRIREELKLDQTALIPIDPYKEDLINNLEEIAKKIAHE